MSPLVRLAVGLVCAAIAYAWATGFERRLGRRPMSSPAWGWALFCAIFNGLGLIALVVSEVVGRVKGPSRSPLANESVSRGTPGATGPAAGSAVASDNILPG
jgi:hypothetical protein